jgi:hypothetical protein
MFHIVPNRKSQTSVEFIIVLIIILIIFVFLFSIYADSANEVSLRKETAAAKRIVQTVAFGINDVYLSGTPKTIQLPSTLIGRASYTLLILPDEHLVSLEWIDGYYSYPILTSNVSTTLILPGTYLLTYEEGAVVFS